MTTILFPCDVAYGYDALSILIVKTEAVLIGSQRYDELSESYYRASAILCGQVGETLHERVLASPEYQAMIAINQRLFREFDWLHTEGPNADAETVKTRAIETDRINGVDRPAAKRALQERWFGTVPNEVKIGYGEESKP